VKRFRYCWDPLFLSGVSMYAANRFVFRPHTTSAFLRGQFDDLLLIPCALPPLLWLHRALRLRSHDRPPEFSEVLLHVVVWSVVCEAIGPKIFHGSTADPLDILAYVVGGLIAWLWWRGRRTNATGAS
jgi:hypothetical protein